MAQRNSSRLQCFNDESIGPTVQGCRSNFDFTLLFEHIVLAIVPSCCLILLGVARAKLLHRKDNVVTGERLRVMKQTAITVYTALHISILAVITSNSETHQPTAIAAGILVIGSSLVIALLSWLEHARSLRPSLLLNTYLFLTLLFDIAQARTLLLNSTTSVGARLFTASIAVKLLVLSLEVQPKTRWLQNSDQVHSNEETSGPFGLSTFYWLTSLITLGNRKVFDSNDLPNLDVALSVKQQLPLFERAWTHSSHRGTNRLVYSLGVALGRRALYPILPRMARIGFSFCQPFLIQGLSRYLNQQSGLLSNSYGYGWIGATFLTYSGIAITSAIYWYLQQRAITIVRADLVASIFRKTTQLSISHSEKSATLTLMSTDVERIKGGLQNINEVWANTIEVALAAWLLQRQIGTAFLVPLAVVVLCVILTMRLGKFAGKRQNAWMEATQKRVSSISSIIAGIKSLKMLGFTTKLTETIQGQRIAELHAANRYRVIGVLATVIGFTPLLLVPVFTFAATNRTLDTERVFTSLGYLLLLSNPLAQLFQLVPQMVAALACFDRVAKFLQLENHSDKRKLQLPTLENNSSSSDNRNTDAIRSKERSPHSNQESIAISFQEASFAWDLEKTPILQSINLSIPSSKTTIIVGPVSSGKSSLCKALLGELNPLNGAIYVPVSLSPIAFCDQTHWLPNGTIRECIVGNSHMDIDWYRMVLEYTDLQYDLDQLPDGSLTLIGSNGIALSGGQKARVALARALYIRAKFIVLDDIFSGLDGITESKIWKHLFGRHGIFCSQGATVVLVTHNARHLRFADHIVALSADGRVVEEGNLSELKQNRGYVASLANGSPDEIENFPSGRQFQQSTTQKPSKPPSAPRPQSEDQARQLGDRAVYAYYFSLFGSFSVVYFLFSCLIFGFLYNFSTMWLKFWSDYNMENPNDTKRRGFYLGIYAMIQVFALLALGVFVQHNRMNMAVTSGRRLHLKALLTVMAGPLNFFSHTDAGTTVNRFSQDFTIIDGELSFGLSNTALTSAAALGQAAIIAVASPYVAICYPFLLILLYGIQKLYLRTSRQLRFLDLETKAPLYTRFLETAAGLASLRAFGWIDAYVDGNDELLDYSQKPVYLLAMVQQWLQAVLNWVVAVLATILVILATQLRTNAGFNSVGLISLMTFSQKLTSIVVNWTQLETSIGAVSRLKSFSENVESENLPDEKGEAPDRWPEHGSLEIRGVSASYNQLNSLEQLALDDVSISIHAGEKVAIVGRTGSGKSSLILLLLKLLDPISSSTSRMMIDGINLKTVNREILRSRLIAIPQDSFLHEQLTWRQNLQADDGDTLEDCERVLKEVDLLDKIRSSGILDTLAKPDILSHGQKQLFGLARAVLKGRQREKRANEPFTGEKKTAKQVTSGGVLLLDEISSSVDEATEATMHRIIMREFAAYTIIAIAHRFNSVNDFDTIIIMEGGKVKERGPACEILARLDLPNSDVLGGIQCKYGSN